MRTIRQIVENAITDAEQRKIATIALNKTIALLNKNNDFKINPEKFIDINDISIKIKINNYEYDFDLQFTEFILGGIDGTFDIKNNRPRITINLNPIFKNEKEITYKNIINYIKNNFRIFVHEFIHYLDWYHKFDKNYELMKKSAKDTKIKNNSFEKFLNNPVEYNAVIQQVMDEIEKTIQNDIKNKTYTKELKLALNNFKDFEKYYLQKYNEILKPKFKNKFYNKQMKRIYKFWNYLKQKYIYNK